MCRIRLLASKFVQYFLKRKLCLICRLSFIQIGWRLSSACQSVYRINSDLFSLFLNFHTFLRWRQEAVLVWRQRQALYRHSISKKKNQKHLEFQFMKKIVHLISVILIKMLSNYVSANCYLEFLKMYNYI
jgi:hypothetical protein